MASSEEVKETKENSLSFSKPEGYCLVVDNSQCSSKQHSRCLPIKRLCHILKEQFHILSLHLTSLSLSSIQLLLNTIGATDQSDSSVLIVIMITPNKEGVIEGADGKSITTKQVMASLSDREAPGLVNIPKIYLFQTLSQDQTDDKVKLTCSHPVGSSQPHLSHLPLLLDTMRSYSDSSLNGSIFINNHQISFSNEGLNQAFIVPEQFSEQSVPQCLLSELQSLLMVFLPIREKVLTKFAESESLIIKTCHDIYTNKLLGGTGGLAGTIFTVTGLALIPVTLGVSLILTGVGAGLGAVGGVTAVVSTINDAINKGELVELKYLMELDYQISVCINNVWERLGSCNNEGLSGEFYNKLDLSSSEGTNGALVSSMDLVELMGKAYKQLNNKELSAIVWLKRYIEERQKGFEQIKDIYKSIKL
ncbi:PREDICTED: uncharacterized protein LOC100634437 [Amphimedon queenslandica]|uniref:Caspase family p20 domain-containing protein n=1 Tax=Amphimedon queenslandica TaxID=400682 RepID=A0A1X7UZF2_AMPQE|nr:PREDICTED: uncharacterized protein LOC100634437 [Amphimedon queenslandica]|eukprot:XP_003386323.1 PREDICTED: uncharacterized protein LOC100634437 [Amphimedon queenslandica]